MSEDMKEEFTLKISDLEESELEEPPESGIMQRIEEKNLSMSDLDYFTRRELQNREGEDTGRAVVAKFKDEEKMDIEYKCPYCGHEEYAQIENQRPPFKFNCNNCGKIIRIKRLKDTGKK